MIRYLKQSIENDALADFKMAFITGPRQVGKTTLAQSLMLSEDSNYFNWDEQAFKVAWSKSPIDAISMRREGTVVLDEIQKDRRWKGRVKGLYDMVGKKVPIIVTGSARMDVFRKGGDSLVGRYIPYHLNPLSVGESEKTVSPDEVFQRTKPCYLWADLIKLGGFPEPLLSGSELKANRWGRLRLERLLREDVRDLRNISDINALSVLVALMPRQVGGLLSINSLRVDADIAYGTAHAWIGVLETLYHHFVVKPYSKKLSRAVRAEPKLFLYDILQVKDVGARKENLIALHLLKACQFWTDVAFGVFELSFIRTKEKEEVDFCVLRDGKVWLLVECKSGAKALSKHLVKFTEHLRPQWSFQLVDDTSYDRFYAEYNIRVTSLERFCAGLV
jgi:predicted AAA+ superfamily ATPase